MPTLLGLGDQTEDELAARIIHGIEREIAPKSRALMDRGKREEPCLLLAYETIYGTPLERKVRRVHPEHSFLGAAPDGVTGRNIVEVKTVTRWVQTSKDPAKRWGWAGSADIPAAYAAQVQCQLECCDAERAYVWACFGEDEDDGSWRTDWIARYVVSRDRDFGANLVALAVDFWARRVAPFQEAA